MLNYTRVLAEPTDTEGVLKAIAEPRRREILRLVRDRELSAGEIATHFEVTRPAVSQHVGVLKRSGLVSERREGARRLYRARPEGLADLRAFLEDFWGDRLSRLKAEAEAEQARRIEAQCQLSDPPRSAPWSARCESRPGPRPCSGSSPTRR